MGRFVVPGKGQLPPGGVDTSVLADLLGEGQSADSSSPDSPTYEVGYGKPPVHSRFVAGQRGGPGRPRGAKNRATLFREAFDTPRPVTIAGKRQRLTNQDIAYRQLATEATKGNLRAIALAEQIRAAVCGSDQVVETVVPPLTDAELAILRRRGE